MVSVKQFTQILHNLFSLLFKKNQLVVQINHGDKLVNNETQSKY